MIERAELCVQRNSTLNAGVMASHLVAVVVGGDQPGDIAAQVRPAVAAVARQKFHQAAKCFDVRAVVHGASVALHLDQPGPAQHAEMRGHGVVRHVAEPREFARRNGPRMRGQQPAKHREARGLGERAQPVNGLPFA